MLRSAVVVLEQAAETLMAVDLAVCFANRFPRGDERVAQALVIPLSMIVLDELLDGPPELLIAKEDPLAKALGLDGSDKAFSMWIGL